MKVRQAQKLYSARERSMSEGWGPKGGGPKGNRDDSLRIEDVLAMMRLEEEAELLATKEAQAEAIARLAAEMKARQAAAGAAKAKTKAKAQRSKRQTQRRRALLASMSIVEGCKAGLASTLPIAQKNHEDDMGQLAQGGRKAYQSKPKPRFVVLGKLRMGNAKAEEEEIMAG